uniref:Uncharacterized protein n=1 Tax=Chenopodium quinoa TaxID=63459 RepID=A0A803LIQ2_CHEQI
MAATTAKEAWSILETKYRGSEKPESKKLIISRNVIFDEGAQWQWNENNLEVPAAVIPPPSPDQGVGPSQSPTQSSASPSPSNNPRSPSRSPRSPSSSSSTPETNDLIYTGTDPRMIEEFKKAMIPVTGNPARLSDFEFAQASNGSQIVDSVGVLRNTLEFNRAGCYYAASMLRLFTKDAASWIKAQEHIKGNYKKFTGLRFDLGEFDIWGPSVDDLRKLYQTNSIYRRILGQIHYFVKGIEEGKQMTQMLFEQHLAFTGMHIVELFCRGCTGLKAARPDLLNALFHGGNQTILEQLEKILKEYMGSEDEAKKRETYKFARLYDPMMFSFLQTKNCADIVRILAHIDKLCGNVGSGDVMGLQLFP